MSNFPFHQVAEELELAGLLWLPEIGDEIAERRHRELISVLVDPHGMSPTELRSIYLWLPSVEQMVFQLEARQAMLYHAGLELTERSMVYKTVVQSPAGVIECVAESLRHSMGLALRNLLLHDCPRNVN